ncbi:MAG TPA: exodeoxyribonuclease VII large subunit [Candidatus Saccharimonadales bacterium]|nr:exodeoxyribonuclease VII large subunit [Candidatus Saccharimonadales bacterium]
MNELPDLEMTVSEFVALLNQSLEYAYPTVTITGELANLRVSKSKWLYFDLKDDLATVKFFGTVYQLPGPLEDGMVLKVRGMPRLHPQYGFSVNVMSIQPAGEGSIRRAADLLQAKLAAEGLFDAARKRPLPYPPQRIGLITSAESAAYHDFIKILKARWGGVDIQLIDVQVQGEAAPTQIVQAIEQFNELADPPEVLVIIRGGGSAEDLTAFSSESVTRAVAASRVPTLVAIGHEVDLCLAELAADRRASTPSNAAEMLTPDKKAVITSLHQTADQLYKLIQNPITTQKSHFQGLPLQMGKMLDYRFLQVRAELSGKQKLLETLSPQACLKRGYAIVRSNDAVVKSIKAIQKGQELKIDLYDGKVISKVDKLL